MVHGERTVIGAKALDGKQELREFHMKFLTMEITQK